MKRPTPEQFPAACHLAALWYNPRTGRCEHPEHDQTPTCVHCGSPLTNDGGVLVDATGGDVCGVNGGNEPHEIHTGPVYVTWDEINHALDIYDEAPDSERDAAIESLLTAYDNATPEQREHIISEAGEWVRG